MSTRLDCTYPYNNGLYSREDLKRKQEATATPDEFINIFNQQNQNIIAPDAEEINYSSVPESNIKFLIKTLENEYDALELARKNPEKAKNKVKKDSARELKQLTSDYNKAQKTLKRKLKALSSQDKASLGALESIKDSNEKLLNDKKQNILKIIDDGNSAIIARMEEIEKQLDKLKTMKDYYRRLVYDVHSDKYVQEEPVQLPNNDYTLKTYHYPRDQRIHSLNNTFVSTDGLDATRKGDRPVVGVKKPVEEEDSSSIAPPKVKIENIADIRELYKMKSLFEKIDFESARANLYQKYEYTKNNIWLFYMPQSVKEYNDIAQQLDTNLNNELEQLKKDEEFSKNALKEIDKEIKKFSFWQQIIGRGRRKDSTLSDNTTEAQPEASSKASSEALTEAPPVVPTISPIPKDDSTVQYSTVQYSTVQYHCKLKKNSKSY